MDLQTFTNSQDFLQATLKLIESLASRPVAQRRVSPRPLPPALIALSGGSSPKAMYQAMAETMELNKYSFYQVDERYVPADHPDSNQLLITQTLLSNDKNKPHSMQFFNTTLSIEASLKDYEQKLPSRPFDLMILGIGPDGHTASLFPETTVLDETERPVAYTTTEQFAIFDRLTLTFPPILAAKNLLVLLQGESKQNVLDELHEGPLTAHEYPAKRLLEHPRLTILYKP